MFGPIAVAILVVIISVIAVLFLSGKKNDGQEKSQGTQKPRVSASSGGAETSQKRMETNQSAKSFVSSEKDAGTSGEMLDKNTDEVCAPQGSGPIAMVPLPEESVEAPLPVPSSPVQMQLEESLNSSPQASQAATTAAAVQEDEFVPDAVAVEDYANEGDELTNEAPEVEPPFQPHSEPAVTSTVAPFTPDKATTAAPAAAEGDETSPVTSTGASPEEAPQRPSSLSVDEGHHAQSAIGRESAQFDDTDLVDMSPRPSEDCGEGRSSLTLDTSLPSRTSSRGPNSLQRHDSQRSERTVSPMRSPAGRLSTAGSHYQYKRGGDSWIKNTSIEATPAAASPVSVTPVRHSLPKKIIPVTDDQQPLALRQGQKITEYESGLQAGKQRESSRIQETRRKNITDVVARVLLDGDAAQLPQEVDPTQIIVDPNIGKRTIVKQMTQKFSAPNVLAGEGLDSPRDANKSESSATATGTTNSEQSTPGQEVNAGTA